MLPQSPVGRFLACALLLSPLSASAIEKETKHQWALRRIGEAATPIPLSGKAPGKPALLDLKLELLTGRYETSSGSAEPTILPKQSFRKAPVLVKVIYKGADELKTPETVIQPTLFISPFAPKFAPGTAGYDKVPKAIRRSSSYMELSSNHNVIAILENPQWELIPRGFTVSGTGAPGEPLTVTFEVRKTGKAGLSFAGATVKIPESEGEVSASELQSRYEGHFDASKSKPSVATGSAASWECIVTDGKAAQPISLTLDEQGALTARDSKGAVAAGPEWKLEARGFASKLAESELVAKGAGRKLQLRARDEFHHFLRISTEAGDKTLGFGHCF